MSDIPWAIIRPHTIRWAECDLYGHLNHAAYLTLFEDLRVDHWQALTDRTIRPDAPNPVLARIEARYLRAVGFNDRVTLGCRVASFRRTSFVQEYAMWKDGEACCEASAVCVVTRQDSGAKVALSPEWRAALAGQGAREE